jgi:hypothetical protein
MSPISKPIPQEILKYIPVYDGSPIRLAHYIEIVSDISTNYCVASVTENSANHWMLFNAALSKLVGPAENIGYNNNCSNVKELLEALKRNFADSRTAQDIIYEITTMKSHHKESPIDFLNRLSEKRTTVLTKYKLDNISGETLTRLITQLDFTLVRTLCYGVHPQLGEYLQILQINNLDDARHKLINDCTLIMNRLKHRESDKLNQNHRLATRNQISENNFQ